MKKQTLPSQQLQYSNYVYLHVANKTKREKKTRLPSSPIDSVLLVQISVTEIASVGGKRYVTVT